jgi:hypothetical protein
MDRQDKVRGYRTWRSLDQPAAFFGIKGRFMTLFIIIAAAAAVIAITVGSNYGTMLGMVAFGALAFCDYMLILSLQAKMSDKEFSRLISKSGLTRFVKVTPDSLQSHLNKKVTWK